jgi:hypothetical protein
MKTIALVAAAALLGRPALAQEWRTLDVARQIHDSSALNAKITYGAGTFTLGAASTPADLYEMRIRYPAGQTTPVAKYDAATHAVDLGIESKTFTIPGGDVDQNEMHIGLARRIPLNVMTEVGAADVKIDLGGLSVNRLELETGAADATLAFSSPNAIPMQSMMLKVGAAGFKATGLANARCNHIVLKAGIGDWDLYFDGQWSGDITLDATIGLGSLTIHVPDDVRVDQNAKVVLGAITGHLDATADSSSMNDDEDSDMNDDDSASTSARSDARSHDRSSGGSHPHARPQPSTPAAHTLHILGSATLGQIQFDHKLAGDDGQ